MKKICITLATIFIILLTAGCDALAFGTEKEERTEEYIRIHVRANSDDEKDQSVKYEIKDATVSALTPLVAKCKSREDAFDAIKKSEKLIEETADKILAERGFSYTSAVKVENEKFPTRVYDDVTLPCGYYDAVIVELGKAEGKNWWCVVYPPLCFTNGDVKYKSKIAEIIKEFKDKFGK